MSRNADRMRYLVNDLLDFSRMETGKLKLIKIHFDLCETVKEITQDLSIKAKEKNITLKADVPQDGKIELFADRERIKQVLVNLITNAIKFTQEKGHVTAGCLLKDRKDVELYVKDDGIGIPRDKFNKVFEKFYQIDGSVSRSQPGFGLGLAIVKSIVDAHQGKIYIESEIGKGTKFTVSLALKN
jgi:signal transduction histidine kinase